MTYDHKIGKLSKSFKKYKQKPVYKTFPRKSVEEFIKSFDSIENKSQCKFIHLGIAEFSPSISEEILDNEILFAQQYIDIPEKDLRIIKHCRKSLLYNDNKSWKKKNRMLLQRRHGQF